MAKRETLVLRDIDMNLLIQQKEILVGLLLSKEARGGLTKSEVDALSGILHLLDACVDFHYDGPEASNAPIDLSEVL